MSNSRLVNYIKISPNSTNPRRDKIRKITIHHMSGNLSVETCGNVFQPVSRQASSNYAVDTDGRVGMYVEEKNRAWTSGNSANDHQAITIEVANDVCSGNWHVSDKALEKTIELCVDICKRNGIEKLNYTGNASGNLTMHRWFQATDCPGDYLASKFPYIASEVNKRLAGPIEPPRNWVNVTLQPSVGADTQRWKIERTGDYYRFINKGTGYALDLADAKTSNDSNIQACTANGTDAQLWRIIDTRKGLADYKKISPKLAQDKYLSVEKNGVGGNNAKIWQDLNNSKQEFYLRKETDGYYIIIHTFTGKAVTAQD